MSTISWALLVEDDEEHRLLVRTALAQLSAALELHEVEDGGDAMAWLRDRVEDGKTENGLVILDLGLPRISGFDVLEWIRGRPNLKTVPVVILTASENPLDAEHAFNLGASAYFQKPADFRLYQGIFARVFRLVGAPVDDAAAIDGSAPA